VPAIPFEHKVESLAGKQIGMKGSKNAAKGNIWLGRMLRNNELRYFFGWMQRGCGPAVAGKP
jgi:hypothetical protein